MDEARNCLVNIKKEVEAIEGYLDYPVDGDREIIADELSHIDKLVRLFARIKGYEEIKED